jgi:hypothetical protein
MTSVDPTYIKERPEHLRDRRRSQSAAAEGVVLAMDEVGDLGDPPSPQCTTSCTPVEGDEQDGCSTLKRTMAEDWWSSSAFLLQPQTHPSYVRGYDRYGNLLATLWGGTAGSGYLVGVLRPV